MANTNAKQTSKVVATKASAILRDVDIPLSAKSKSVAGSALAQAKPNKSKKKGK